MYVSCNCFIARESSIIYLFQSCLLISNITPKSFLGFVHKGIERISGMIRATVICPLFFVTENKETQKICGGSVIWLSILMTLINI